MRITMLSSVLLLSALVLFGCSAPAKSNLFSGIEPGLAPVAATPAPKPIPPEAAQPLEGSRQQSGYGLDSSIPNAASADKMIVYNSSVALEVQDAEKAANDVAAIVAQFKGYISATNMSRGQGGQMSGTLTVRVPAENLDEAQKQIEAIGLRVLTRNKSSNDVTDRYTDLNARLTNLEAAEKELRELLATTRERTGRAEDILAVYNQLTNVRGQIEQIKGQMNVLSQTSAMATLSLSLIPRAQVQVIEPEGWLPDRIAREALRALVSAIQGLATVGIWSILFLLPLAIVLVLPLIVVAIIIRSILRRNRTRTLKTA